MTHVQGFVLFCLPKLWNILKLFATAGKAVPLAPPLLLPSLPVHQTWVIQEECQENSCIAACVNPGLVWLGNRQRVRIWRPDKTGSVPGRPPSGWSWVFGKLSDLLSLCLYLSGWLREPSTTSVCMDAVSRFPLAPGLTPRWSRCTELATYVCVGSETMHRFFTTGLPAIRSVGICGWHPLFLIHRRALQHSPFILLLLLVSFMCIYIFFLIQRSSLYGNVQNAYTKMLMPILQIKICSFGNAEHFCLFRLFYYLFPLFLRQGFNQIVLHITLLITVRISTNIVPWMNKTTFNGTLYHMKSSFRPNIEPLKNFFFFLKASLSNANNLHGAVR